MATPPEASSSTAVWTATELAEGPHAAPDKAARVQAMFAAVAGRYDLNNRLHSFGRDQAWRRAAVRRAQVGPDDAVLDVACGTGDLTEALADAGPAEIIGLDFTDAMLERARAKAARRRRPVGIASPRYVRGDAMGLPFDGDRFDVVTIAFGIRNVADPARALREFRRVLRPRGRLVVLEFGQPSNPLLRALSRAYTERIMPVTATWVAGDRSGAYRYLPRSVATFAGRETLREMIAAAGFEGVEARPLTFGICAVLLGRRPG